MINTSARITVSTFNTINSRDSPHAVLLTEKKNKDSFTDIAEVPGAGTGIEKMTHPLARMSEQDHCSPYMIDLLGSTAALTFAEKTLFAPRQRLLDSWGIDDTQQHARQAKLHSDQVAISRYYTHSSESPPSLIKLNGSMFMEQSPTNPYFINQKIITPDLNSFRTDRDKLTTDLLHCKTRDDSELFFNTTPLLQLAEYNLAIDLKESSLRNSGALKNNPLYFTEMVDYLAQRGSAGDFIVQNSLASSSDPSILHFQFIPGNVPLPLFAHAPQGDERSNTKMVDWYFPVIWTSFGAHQADWSDTTAELQRLCQEVDSLAISTTPLFRKREDDRIEALLIFKRENTTTWCMTPETLPYAPGWLEACGLFIANTKQSERFNVLGTEAYYESYRVPADNKEAIQRIFCDWMT